MSLNKILLCFLALTVLQVACDPPKLPLYAGRSYDLLTGNPLSDQVDPGFMHSISILPTIKRSQLKMESTSFLMVCPTARSLPALFQPMSAHIEERNPIQKNSKQKQLFPEDTMVPSSALPSQPRPLTTTFQKKP